MSVEDDRPHRCYSQSAGVYVGTSCARVYTTRGRNLVVFVMCSTPKRVRFGLFPSRPRLGSPSPIARLLFHVFHRLKTLAEQHSKAIWNIRVCVCVYVINVEQFESIVGGDRGRPVWRKRIKLGVTWANHDDDAAYEIHRTGVRATDLRVIVAAEPVRTTGEERPAKTLRRRTPTTPPHVRPSIPVVRRSIAPYATSAAAAARIVSRRLLPACKMFFLFSYFFLTSYS